MQDEGTSLSRRARAGERRRHGLELPRAARRAATAAPAAAAASRPALRRRRRRAAAPPIPPPAPRPAASRRAPHRRARRGAPSSALRGAAAAPRRMRATVIDRDEVLHVARLARLALGEEEIEPMARELSAVLDHIAKIGELDLDGRPADLARGRGDRRAAPRRAARRACRARSRSRRRPRSATTASSSRARRHERHRPARAVGRAGGGRDRRGALSAGELFEAYRARAAADRGRRRGRAELLHVGRRGRARARPARRRCAGVPLAVKDLFCTEGVPSQSGSRILEGYLPPYTATRRRAPARRRRERCWRRPTRTSSRWAPRTRTRPSAPVRNPWDRGARARRLLRRQRRRGRRRASRRGRSAPTPAARSASRPRCAGSSG